jgi:hypothetical protein
MSGRKAILLIAVDPSLRADTDVLKIK